MSGRAAVVGLALVLLPLPVAAGGGPLDVLVVYNGDVGEAEDVALSYAEARSIPARQLCPLQGVDPEARSISFSEFADTLRAPVEACIASLPEPDEIDYLVLVRGLPYRVELPDEGFFTSASAALQIGRASNLFSGEELAGSSQRQVSGVYQASVGNPLALRGDADPLDFTVENPFSSSYLMSSALSRMAELPSAFRRSGAGSAGMWDFSGDLYIVSRLDGFDFEDARTLVTRGMDAERERPEGEWLCMEAAQSARGARDPECELATRLLDGLDAKATWLAPFEPELAGREVIAYFTGASDMRDAIDGVDYAPGAIVDNLTSFGAAPANFFCSEDGALCPENEAQTSIARFIAAGATGAHGTVAEPLNNVFPGASALLLYRLGYGLGESFFFSQPYLYWQNILLGDPLVTPFAERPELEVLEAVEGEPLVVRASHPHGVAVLRAYVDGMPAGMAEGSELRLELDLVSGQEVDLLVTATARNAPVPVPDWPVGQILPQPDTQGWIQERVVVSPAPTVAEQGCGCHAAPRDRAPLVWGLVLLLLGGAVGRRRRAAAG